MAYQQKEHLPDQGFRPDGYLQKSKNRRNSLITTAAPSIILFVLFLGSSACSLTTGKEIAFNYASGKPSDKAVVAEINGHSLTYREFLRQYNLFFVMSAYPEEFRQLITLESYLDQYISEMLMIQEATRLGIGAASPGEVEEQMESYLSKTHQTKDDFLNRLHKAGFSMEDANRFLERNFIINLLSDMKFGEIEISDEEAREFYSGNPNYYTVPESVRASHILICHKESPRCHGDLTREEARKLAEHIRTLARPDNFADLARQYSMDTSAKDGGDLGYIYKDMTVQVFEDSAFKLAAGDISDVVESDFGFHIIYVAEKKEPYVIGFEEAKESIKENLKSQRVQAGLASLTAELRQKADVKIYPILSSKETGHAGPESQGSAATENGGSSPAEPATFNDTGKDICRNDDGLPVVILFSSSSCSHCKWIGETFDSTVREYAEKGLINAHHFEIDTNDDLLTPDVETEIPQRYLDLDLTGNPDGYVPYFNFGCMYDRIGNGYEDNDDLAAEEREFRWLIDSLLTR